MNYINCKISNNKNVKHFNELKSKLKKKTQKDSLLKIIYFKKIIKKKPDEINFYVKLDNQPPNQTNNISDNSKVNESDNNLVKNKYYDFLIKVPLNKHKEKICHKKI